MRIHYARVVALLTFAFIQTAQSDSPKQSVQRHTSTSSIEFKMVDGKEHTIVRNQRFTVIPLCIDECSQFVLHESFFSDQEASIEGGRTEVSVRAWRKDAPGSNVWTIRAAGDAGTPLDDFYRVTLHGCCGDWDEMSYFSLRTGKKVYSSSSDDEKALLTIEVPNARTKRYITFSYSQSGTLLGRIQFGDAEQVRQVVTIREPSPSRPPTIALRVAREPDSDSVTLWAHNGDKSSKALSGVTLVLKFDAEEVLIPIENDRLATQRAKAPKGYRLSN